MLAREINIYGIHVKRVATANLNYVIVIGT